MTVGVPIVGVCFEKGVANGNRRANGVPKPTPIIEANNRIDKCLQADAGMRRVSTVLPDGAPDFELGRAKEAL